MDWKQHSLDLVVYDLIFASFTRKHKELLPCCEKLVDYNPELGRVAGIWIIEFYSCKSPLDHIACLCTDMDAGEHGA